jgi:hypothetical protein
MRYEVFRGGELCSEGTEYLDGNIGIHKCPKRPFRMPHGEEISRRGESLVTRVWDPLFETILVLSGHGRSWCWLGCSQGSPCTGSARFLVERLSTKAKFDNSMPYRDLGSGILKPLKKRYRSVISTMCCESMSGNRPWHNLRKLGHVRHCNFSQITASLRQSPLRRDHN